jgi:hypothetical protein
MSSYLDLPYPRHYRLPIAMSSVMQSHWLPFNGMPRTIYVVRDGRDVLVSRYFYEVHWALAEGNRRSHARFIEAELTQPALAKVTWQGHVDAWLDEPHDRVATVRYEDLVESVEDTLAPVFEQLTGVETDREYLRLAASRFEFRRMADQAKRGVNQGPYMRKGVAGDWRNHFSEEASGVFDLHAGETLRRLGYEG